MFRLIHRFWASRSPEAVTDAHTGSCEALQPLLSAWMDDELTQAERRRVETHLETCTACRLDLSEMEACRTQLQCAGEVEIPSMAHAAIRDALRLEFAHTQTPEVECSIFRPLLSPFIDAELPISQRDAVAAHVDDCRECAAQLKTLRRTVRLVASLPPVAPPTGLRALVLARTSQKSGRVPMVPAGVGALALAGLLFLVLPPPARQPEAPLSHNRVAEVSPVQPASLIKAVHTAPLSEGTPAQSAQRTVAEKPHTPVIQRVRWVSAHTFMAPKDIVRAATPVDVHPIVVIAPAVWQRPVITPSPRTLRSDRAPTAAPDRSPGDALPASHGKHSDTTAVPLPGNLMARETSITPESPGGETASKVAVVGSGLHSAAPSMPARPSLPAAGQTEAPPPPAHLSPVITAMAAPPSNAPGIWTARSFTASDEASGIPQVDQYQQNQAVVRMNRQTQFYLHQARAMELHPGSVSGQSINGYTYLKLANGHGGLKW